jgi:DNA-binding GntR family transcriptional regulator
MERTWIKLYLKILDDPRMGRLPVATWKRAMEFFMVAGEYELGNEGRLPPLDDMAWRLRASVEELNEALQVLSNAGIVHQGKDGAWVVSDFAKQQEPLGVAERVRDHRRRKRNVTKSYIAEVEACNDDVEAAAAEDVTSDSYSSSASSWTSPDKVDTENVLME